MNEAAFRAEQLKALQGAETGEPDPGVIITGMRLDDGSYHVLSRYGDPVWTLPDALFAAGKKDNQKKLNFDRVPPVFRGVLRTCVAHYMLAGIEGRGRPKGSTIHNLMQRAASYLTWLDDRGIGRLSEVTPLVAQQYVDFCRSLKSRKGEPLSANALVSRLVAVENLQILSQHTADPMPPPWPESSAKHLAGLTGQGNPYRQEAKTTIIPDDVLGPLFQSAVDWLDRADDIIDRWEQIQAWAAHGLDRTERLNRANKQGWSLGEANSAARDLQSACMVIILVTSGIRVSELCSLETGCTATKEGDYGDRYHWMRGVSYKTGAGPCDWLVAELTHRAIAVAERLASPLQARLTQTIAELRAANPRDPAITRLSEHASRLFLAVQQKKNNRIGTLSTISVIDRLNAFAAQCGLDWHFAPHQFRRTFAVYAAHSAFGDLRYLRDHFKHWSLDMTGLYAMNRQQDAELYDEIGLAALGIKTDLLEHWLEPDAILAGGAAEPVRAFRAKSKAVATKHDRADMAKTLSPLVHIRATGVAWCTADTGGCNGGQGAEKTRCGDCGNAIIGESRKPVWQGIYAQQIELRQLPDIGPGGQERVERDLQRCRKVLTDLGASEEELDDVAT
ncbi:tyrosine-type recombinase/integrase [Marinobacter goseongensis]|uniref:tyrosine-type recombinase/integrase n=1 Tax=Marinobacter goseongensis TaxID=453838 RepID=UPI002004F6C8|nr:tyrosine-type recombinase/integrase [Marinobacter goseongensis]MCK7550674.1 tyrosine-type recombinase/integrase [Marinobacter goseongensis]